MDLVELVDNSGVSLNVIYIYMCLCVLVENSNVSKMFVYVLVDLIDCLTKMLGLF